MITAEVATQLVSLCREGRFVDAVETLYADDVVSVEAMDYQGLGREMRQGGRQGQEHFVVRGQRCP